jgi:hypothetical protein
MMEVNGHQKRFVDLTVAVFGEVLGWDRKGFQHLLSSELGMEVGCCPFVTYMNAWREKNNGKLMVLKSLLLRPNQFSCVHSMSGLLSL